MADENVNVEFTVTAPGLAKLEKALQAIRQEMHDLGMDMKPVEKSLGAAETQIVKIKKSADGAAKSTEGAAKSARGWAETMSTVWKRQYQDGEKVIAQADRIAKAQEDAAKRAARSQIAKNAPRQAADEVAKTNWNTSFQTLSNASSKRNKAAEAKAIAQAEREAAAAVKATAAAEDRAAQATMRRARAESELVRARKRSEDSAAKKQFDADFKEVERSAARAQAAANKVQPGGIADPSTRYALYDVANAFKLIGVAMSGAAIYATVVSARFQAAFSNVERTLSVGGRSAGEFATAVDGIRQSLVQLTGQIPLTFDQVTEIATLGNQMGISEDAVVDFTGTIARFAAVSGVSIDEVTKAFGGFAAQTNLDPKYFENLSSSISLVGVRSNATEAQILSLVREVAATSATAGFAADEIIGLAGTFATLQVAPERARGVLDTYFATLNKALANGGEKLDAFTRITGRTAASLREMVVSGQGADVFSEVISGLASASDDPVELTQNLEALGLSGLRASNTFNRLSQNLDDAKESMANAKEGFMSGAETQRQYEITLQNLSSQWQIFINGLNSLVATISGGALPGLAALFDIINKVLFATIEWLGNNKWAVYLGVFVTALVGTFGAMLLFRGLLTAATATVYAAQTAIVKMGGSSIYAAGTVRGLAGALFGLGGGARAAAGGVGALKIAIRGLLASTGIGLLILLLGGAAEAIMGTGEDAADASLSMGEYEDAIKNVNAQVPEAEGGAKDLGKALDGAGGSAEEAAKKVRTLVDYASDLTGVFNRSKDLRFGAADAMDNITLKWIEMNEEMAKYQAQVRSLTADKALREYWLGIATLYDDQIRASQLREEIADIDDNLATANAGASTELQGNSRAAIENRKAMRDLLGSYDSYITALASAGASQEQIQAVISQLNVDFVSQATQVGYNGGQLKTYGTRFQDLGTIISQMPRDITVGFNGDAALLAMAEFFAKAEEQARNGGSAAGGAAGGGFNSGFGDSLGGGLPTIPESGYNDLINGINKHGKSGAQGFLGEFGNFLSDGIAPLMENDFVKEVSKFFEDPIGNLDNWISDWVGGQLEEIGNLLGNPLEFIPKWWNEQIDELTGKSKDDGKGVAGGLKSGIAGELAAYNPIPGWASGLDAYGVGSGIGNSIYGGLTDKLNKRLGETIFKSSGGARPGTGTVLLDGRNGWARGGFVPGFSDGGYTGSGHWLKPAGYVHAGEYVIPKRHVDQRSGLPDVDYVASLRRARPSTKSGYATGGYVGGSGIPGTIELGPASLGAIVNGLSVKINVGREQLASAVSGGDRRLAWTGSN